MVFLHINNNSDNTDTLLNKLDSYLRNKDVFMLIYMEGCGPCNQVRPEWKKLENVLKKYKNDNNVIIVDVDKDLIHKLKNIKKEPDGFPTIIYSTKEGNIVENYEDSNITNKDRSIDSFVEWINFKLKENPKKQMGGKTKKKRGGKWSLKYKRSINCNRPKGFSQRQHCKYGRKNKNTFTSK